VVIKKAHRTQKRKRGERAAGDKGEGSKIMDNLYETGALEGLEECFRRLDVGRKRHIAKGVRKAPGICEKRGGA